MTGGPAVEFLARYAESEGGLAELGADGCLLVLPDHLRKELSLPEELRVTSDPEVAREDGAVLVAAGHPLLSTAARLVLDKGDIGCAQLPGVVALPPAQGVLEAKARDQLVADHGRLDITGAPTATDLVVLRLAALVSYSISVDERLQEVEEIWVDSSTGHEVPPRLVATLATAALEPHEDLPLPKAAALAAADGLLAGRVARRVEALEHETSLRLERQLRVVDDYYERVLASLDERRSRAGEHRAELLAAQAEATRAEWSRRRAEVAEELTPSPEARPFRLHVLRVPAYRVPFVVRRGSREYPLDLVYVVATASFLDPGCPSCGAVATLVAGKEKLGCRSCLGEREHDKPAAAGSSTGPTATGTTRGPDGGGRPGTGLPSGGTAGAGPALQPADAGAPPGSPAQGAGRTAPSREPRVPPVTAGQSRGSSGRAGPATLGPASLGRVTLGRANVTSGRVTPKGTRSEGALQRTGLRVAASFWEATWAGELGRRGNVAEGSPLEALLRLYGSEGPALVVGVEDSDEEPVHIATSTTPAGDGVAMTDGELEFRTGRRTTFALFWRQGSSALLELEAFSLDDYGPWLMRRDAYGTALRRRFSERLGPPPPTVGQLAPAPAALLRRAARRLGLAYAARCMAAWWYVTEEPEPGAGAILEPEAGGFALPAAIESVVMKRAGISAGAPLLAEQYGCPPEDLRRFARRIHAAVGSVSGLRW